ncbi:MAG: polysaccharide deacetylase family protein, partial [Planctomycetota bacterium]
APLRFPQEEKPRLLVVIDTEEEFDWNAPFDRANDGVGAMSDIGRAQEVFDEFGIVPTYVIDGPVASKPEGYGPLLDIHRDGRCIIGAHLHPWVSEPFDEEVCARNSYPGNLPPELEKAKLAGLLDTIEKNVGHRPTVYKAGRYGIGPNSARILAELGLEIDLSLCPPFDLSGDGGPDYSNFEAHAYRFGDPSAPLLGLPTTGGFVGAAGSLRPALYRFGNSGPLASLRAPGIFSRLGLVERLFLSPEGYQAEDCIRLTKALLARGDRLFTFSFHSPSVRPGCTPYVGNDAELRHFLEVCRRYFRFFLEELGGLASTPFETRERLDALHPRS